MGGDDWKETRNDDDMDGSGMMDRGNTQGGTRLDDDVFRDEDEDFEKPRRVYENNEKEKWIYGTPGTDDYQSDLTEDEIAELEIMWEYDFALSIVRGLIQGLTRGFYKTYAYSLHPDCFGKDTVMYIYYIVENF